MNDARGVRLTVKGNQVIKPEGLQCWNDSELVVSTLLSGTSPEGYLFEVTISSYALLALVTGIEQYFKTTAYTLNKELAEQVNSFQDLAQAKDFFKKSCGFSLAEISADWEYVRKIFKYSHRVRHSSAIIADIDEFRSGRSSSEFEQDFVNYKQVKKASKILDELVKKIEELLNGKA